MFDRFVLASSYQRIRKRFDMASLPEGEDYVPNYNIAFDSSAYVVISQLTFNPQSPGMPHRMQNFFEDKVPTKAIRSFKFGLMGVEKSITYFIRSEGDRNLNNDPNYSGSKAIFLNNKYKRVIRNQRCLVLVDAFIININSKPYLVYLRGNKRPFGMAGIWNITEDENGVKRYSFGILTTVANQLIKKLGYDRMPVIISEYNERRWLRKNIELSHILSLLNPYPYNLMNAYPISDKIKDEKNNNLSVIQPVGGRIYSEKIDGLPRKNVRLEGYY